MSNNAMMFRTNVNDHANRESLVVLIEGETGRPGTVTVMDRETRETVLVFRLPPGVAMNIGQALNLMAAMEDGQMKDDILRPDGLGD